MAENDFTNAAFHAHLHDQKLMGARCQSCEALYLPPRPMCPNCFGDTMAWEPIQETGTLAAFTTVHIMPTAMLETQSSQSTHGKAARKAAISSHQVRVRSIEIGVFPVNSGVLTGAVQSELVTVSATATVLTGHSSIIKK